MKNNKKPWQSKINVVQCLSAAILILGLIAQSPSFSPYAEGLGLAGNILTVILRSYALNSPEQTHGL